MTIYEILATTKTTNPVYVYNRFGEVVYKGYLSGIPSYLYGAIINSFGRYAFYERSNTLVNVELL